MFLFKIDELLYDCNISLQQNDKTHRVIIKMWPFSLIFFETDTWHPHALILYVSWGSLDEQILSQSDYSDYINAWHPHALTSYVSWGWLVK